MSTATKVPSQETKPAGLTEAEAKLNAAKVAHDIAKAWAAEVIASARALREMIADGDAQGINALYDAIGKGTDGKGKPEPSAFVAAFLHGTVPNLSFQRRMELASRAKNASPDKNDATSPFKTDAKSTGVGTTAKINLRSPAGMQIQVVG